MQQAAHIGPTVVIKGEISAQENVCVSGRVEGRIDVSGHSVTIESGAHVHADVIANDIIISGTTLGSLVAEGRVALRAGAVVDGDVTAPRLAVEDGALLTGKVDVTSSRSADLAQAS
jgi:cytoskeletal protein CcmA (bactofilin family)